MRRGFQVVRRSASRGLLCVVCPALAAGAIQATCGSANCFLVTGTQEGVGARGELVLDLSYRYVVMSRRLEGSGTVREVLTPKIEFDDREIAPDHHREVRTQNTLAQLDVSYGATDRVTIAASFPLLNDRDHEHYDDVGTPSESFTRQDGASGFGDVRIGARGALLVRTKDLLVGALLAELPTGRYRLKDSHGEINEPTIQPGSGSTDLVAGFHYAHQWIPMRLEYFVSGSRKLNGENDLDYRFGTEDLLDAGIRYAPGSRFAWSAQVNGRRTSHDRYLGSLVPSTGARTVSLTPGIRLDFSETASFYAFAQLPILQEVNDAQLAARTGLLLGASFRR